MARLREVLARGATLKDAARTLNRPKTTLHRLAQQHELPRRRRSLPLEKERRLTKLLQREESERVICRLLEIGKGTVYRRKQLRRQRLGLPKVVKKYRCPGPCGNYVVYVPCQICRAMAAPGKSGHEARAL